MKRKLVQQGAATLMVSLPRKWIKTLNLKKGDEISIQEQNHNLILSGEEKRIKKEITINLTHKTEAPIRFLIISLYRAGYEKITIEYSEEKQFQIINQAIKKYLIGFDVTDKRKDSCVIENLTEPSTEQFEIILQKILYNIKSMIELTKERLETKTPAFDYKEVLQTIHQYDNFCRRSLTRQNNEKAVYYWNFLSVIIHNSRDLYNLNQLLDSNPKGLKVSKETIGLTEDSLELVNTIIKAYQKKDIAELGEVDEKKEKLIKAGLEILRKAKGDESEVLYHLISAIRNLYRSTSPLMGLLV